MTLALLGAPRVAGPATDGWGWAGAQDEDSGSIEASSISNLVSYTLSRLQGQASGEETEDLTLAGRLKGNPEALEKLNAYRQEVLSEQVMIQMLYWCIVSLAHVCNQCCFIFLLFTAYGLDELSFNM